MIYTLSELATAEHADVRLAAKICCQELIEAHVPEDDWKGRSIRTIKHRIETAISNDDAACQQLLPVLDALNLLIDKLDMMDASQRQEESTGEAVTLREADEASLADELTARMPNQLSISNEQQAHASEQHPASPNTRNLGTINLTEDDSAPSGELDEARRGMCGP